MKPELTTLINQWYQSVIPLNIFKIPKAGPQKSQDVPSISERLILLRKFSQVANFKTPLSWIEDWWLYLLFRLQVGHFILRVVIRPPEINVNFIFKFFTIFELEF